MKIGPKYKIARRLKSPVFDKTQTQKFALSESRHIKGQKRKKRQQVSEYGSQLVEKQKVRYTYGISERQFSNYVKEAVSSHGAKAGEMLQQFLEIRLDNVIYRMGLAPSRQMSRQMASHGHFLVNGVKVTVPSYRLKVGDIITVREGSKKSVMFQDLKNKLDKYMYPAWITFDPTSMTGSMKSYPTKEGSLLDFGRVLEFYSR